MDDGTGDLEGSTYRELLDDTVVGVGRVGTSELQLGFGQQDERDDGKKGPEMKEGILSSD